MQRTRLSKLGYTVSADELTMYDADMLLAVDEVVQDLRAEEYDKLDKPGRGK